MKNRYTNEEILMRLLLEKMENRKTNSVLLYKNNIINHPMSEKEVILSLHILQTDGYILINKYHLKTI